MKKLFLSAIAVVLAGGAYAIPNTFSEGEIVSAEKMNANFQHLEQQLQGAIEKAVNCAAGEKIADAIANGYTNITVSGTCTENLQFSMWREDSAENGTPTGKLAPRFLKLTGADANAKIVDGSSNTESTLSVNSGATLFLENITVSGGEYGVNAQRNSNLYLSGVTVENFTESGIRVADSAWLGIDDDGATLAGTGAGNGINLATGSSGWISTITISDVDRGIRVAGGSMVYLKGYSISAASRGISIDNSRVLKYGDGSASIEGTSDRAVSVSQGVFTNWEGTLEIKNLSGGRGLDFWMSQGNIHNLKMPDYDNTGSDWNPALSIGGGSSVNINSAEISASTDGPLVSISDGSITEIRESTLTVGNAAAGIEASGSSRLNFRNSTISGSVTDSLVNVSEGSSAKIEDSSTLTITSAENGLRVAGNSRLNFRNSTISGTVTDNLVSVSNRSSADVRDSTLSGTVTDGGLVSVDAGSSAEVRDATLTLESGNRAVGVSDSSDLTIRSSTLSGTATEELVDLRRISNVIIRNESKLSQSGSDTPDVRVSNLSMLSIRNEEASINKVDCYSKGYVSANEGIVTTLSESCTE